MGFFNQLLSRDFTPHGFCYLWDPRLVWLHVISDGLITLSYYCIPIVLVYFIRKNRDLPFNRIFWLFGGFILACGTTHLMEIWTVWHGNYLLAGVIQAITAAVSVMTLAMLIPLVPMIISLPSRIHLQEVNRKLEREIAERNVIEAPLQHRITIGFVVALLLTVFMGLLTWRTRQQASREADLVVHTYAVLGTLEVTLQHVIEVETSARAFAFTGQDPLFAHYETSKVTVAQDVDILRHLTTDNPNQQRRLDVIEMQVRAALDFAESIVGKRRQLQEFPAASEILETERLVDAVRATDEEMKAEERQLLRQRTQRTELGRRLTSFIIVAGIFVGAGLLALAWLAINREIDVSVRARAQISTLNGELEQRVEQRTAALQSEITERKQAEERLARQALGLSQLAEELGRSRLALEAQSLMLQSVLDSMAEGLVAADEQGKFLIWNRAAERIVGYGPADLPAEEWSKHYGNYLPDGVTPMPTEQLPLVRAIRGEVSSTEIFLRNPRVAEGTWIEASGGPLRGKDGVVHGGVVAFRDITQRKADEREILKLNNELEQRVAERTAQMETANKELADQKFALDQHAIVAMTDVQGTITYVNDKFCAISQYSESELLGQNHRILNAGHHSKEFFQQMYRTIAHGQVWHGEIKNRAKGGSTYWLDTTIVPFVGAEGKPRQYAAIRADITERKQAEERVLQRTAELEAANKELEAFSYSVSHDLRAPLRHIGGFSKMLMEEFGPTLDPAAQHYVERIQLGTQRMALLVDELLNLARIGRHSLNRYAVRLNVIVAEVITILEPESEGRQVEWVIADLPVVECDPVLVRQVFQNLLANALKFTRPRARAVIEVSHTENERDGRPVLMVRDNGIGFDMKYVDKLFGVFQRLHRAEDFEGTGIGLATVQRMVQKHGGRVWTEGKLDQGAAFYFTLGAEKQTESKTNEATAGGQS